MSEARTVRFAESVVEDAALDWLQEIGYSLRKSGVMTNRYQRKAMLLHFCAKACQGN
jgi:hypothetical protein